MAGEKGAGKSSEVEPQPLRPAVVGSSRCVFISYASHDAAVAQKVCLALESAEFLCWIAPRNIVPGTKYADGIVHAIDESSILVLILSEQAVASAHVGREIERAVSKRHPVIALRIDALRQGTLASGHYLPQHRADFSVDDDIRPGVHVGRLAVDNGEHSAA
jgi:hypothetical protein